MKKFTTTFFLLMAMVLLLPTEVSAWSGLNLRSSIKGNWKGTNDDEFTKLDANHWIKEIDASTITDDIFFRIYVSDNGCQLYPKSDKKEFNNGSSTSDDYYYNIDKTDWNWKISQSTNKYDKIIIDALYTDKWTVSLKGIKNGEGCGYYLYCNENDWGSASSYCEGSDNELKLADGKYNVTFTIRASTSKFYFCVFNGDKLDWSNAIRPDGTDDVTTTTGTINNTNGKVWKQTTSSDAVTYKLVLDGFTNGSAWTLTKVTAPSVTYTLTYGSTDVHGTVSGANVTFELPQAVYGQAFTIAGSDGKTYNPGAANTPLGKTPLDYTTGTGSWTCAEESNASGYILTLNTTDETVVLAYSTTTVTPPTPVTGENYYLIGDWNNWKVDKTFKFQPVMGEPGKYMLYINAPVNMKKSSGEDYISEFNTNEAGGYVLRFIIAPEDALSGTEVTRGNCYCPETNNPTINITGSAQTTGIAKKYDSSQNAWKLQRNNVDLIPGVNNGGSYRFILDMSDSSNPKWEITSTPNTRVLYFLKESDNYLFDGNYLIDLVGTTKNYNQNFEGIVSMKKGEYYKLSDGYHIYKSIGNGENENGDANRGNGEIKYQKVGFDYTADERVIFPYESGSYVAKANVLNWNDLNMWKTEGPSNRIEWRAYSSGGTTQLSVSYSVAGGEEKPMTFDAENKVWYASCVEIGNSEDVNFKEKHDSDIAAKPTEKNDPNGEGTYKLIYVDTQTTADGKPVDKLLLSNDLGKITNEGVFIRTFSDYYARLIPEGLTAYYATGYDATNKTVNLTSIKDGIIPANTGVVLIYDGNTEGINFDPVMTSDVQTAETVSLEKTDAVGTAPRNNGTEPYGYGSDDNGAGRNWLVTDLKHDKASAGPVTRNESNVITYRNYYLANMDLDGNGSKTLGFYRVKAEGALTDQKNVRKAYLAMPASVQTDGSYDELQDNTSATPVTAAKRVTMIFDGEIIGGTPTGIDEVNVNTGVVSKDNSFYNLQGMKVSKPSKGIYIYRGRKVIIK